MYVSIDLSLWIQYGITKPPTPNMLREINWTHICSTARTQSLHTRISGITGAFENYSVLTIQTHHYNKLTLFTSGFSSVASFAFKVFLSREPTPGYTKRSHYENVA